MTRSAAAWAVLALTGLALFGNYYVYDSIGPLAEQLSRELGYSDTQIGTLNAIYSVPNIVLVFVGGVLVDRYGPGLVTFWTALACLAKSSVLKSRCLWWSFWSRTYRAAESSCDRLTVNAAYPSCQANLTTFSFDSLTHFEEPALISRRASDSATLGGTRARM